MQGLVAALIRPNTCVFSDALRAKTASVRLCKCNSCCMHMDFSSLGAYTAHGAVYILQKLAIG